MRIQDLDTPALLIDLDVMERNLRRAADYGRLHGLRLRPHTKTHKIPAIGRMQLDLGAAGLTVAKVSEAEVMLNAAPEDLLIAYPVVGRAKMERLAAVARRTRVTVALDSTQVAVALSAAARESRTELCVLTEVDVGYSRVGVEPGEALVHLVQLVSRLPHLSWDGIAFYPGQIRDMREPEGQRQLDEVSKTVVRILDELKKAGFTPRVVSGGSTPSLYHSHLVAGLNEIRPGTYVFNDRNTFAAGACGVEDCAATVMCTVVSTSRPGQVLIDGGSKTFSSDRFITSSEVTFGHIVDDPAVVFTKMNEEHGYLDVRRASRQLAVGDRLRIIPNHVCTAMNLHEKVYGVRAGEVEAVWEVAGRGKLQ
jgi:D-serine deaminase-like pyridoxal phosphate-dependent protein